MIDISIVIPTFDREDNLVKTIASIQPCDDVRLKLEIFCEPGCKGVSLTRLEPFCINFVSVTIHESHVFLGCDATIIKALLSPANCRYIFLLGDSKPLKSYAISLIAETIRNYPDAHYINFSFDSHVKETRLVQNLDALIDSGLTFGDFILAGNSIFSKDVVHLYSTFCYQTISSRIAHISIPLMLLKNSHPILVCSKTIISTFLDKPQKDNLYSLDLEWANCWLKFPLITLLPLSCHDLKTLNRYSRTFFNDQYLVFAKYLLINIIRNNRNSSRIVRAIICTRYIYSVDLFDKFILRVIYLVCLLSESLILSRKICSWVVPGR